MSANTRRFALIDAMRGLGALAIACHHIHRYTPQRELVDSVLPDVVQWLLRNGWYGVQMFWVIAGFVLAYSLRDASFTPSSMGRFAARRVLRLGPPYWVAILLVVALTLATKAFIDWPPPDDNLTWAKLAANLVFLQDILGQGNISAGTWFVCVDLQLGLAGAAMLWLSSLPMADRGLSQFSRQERYCGGKTPYRRENGTVPLAPDQRQGGRVDVAKLAFVFMPLGLASLFWFNLDAHYNVWLIYFFHIPLLGMLVWWTLEGRIPRAIFWAYVAAMAAGAAYRWHLGLDKKFLEIIVTLAAGLTIYLAGRRGHLHDWLSAGWLQYLGRISYSLFLIHYPISWIVLQAGSRMTGDSAPMAVALLVAALAASIGAADLLYKLVEMPSLRLCAKLKTRV